MALMTKLQRNYVEDIEKNLDVIYTGRHNRDDANLFIRQHKEENRKFNIKYNVKVPPTGKQLRLIKDIEQVVKIYFEGKTFEDADKFIQEYMNEFKLNQDSSFKFKNICNKKADAIAKKQRKRRGIT